MKTVPNGASIMDATDGLSARVSRVFRLALADKPPVAPERQWPPNAPQWVVRRAADNTLRHYRNAAKNRQPVPEGRLAEVKVRRSFSGWLFSGSGLFSLSVVGSSSIAG